MTRRSLIGATLLAPSAAAAPAAWEARLDELLPLFGHRNWIVVADSAYPAQARPSIETLVAGADQLQVVDRVLRAIEASVHVAPAVYTDRELAFVPETAAPGISAYRRRLGERLRKHAVVALPHEELIAKLDQAGVTFRVLIIKTRLAIPYTSVFFELNCGYWNAEAERKLRAAMAGKP